MHIYKKVIIVGLVGVMTVVMLNAKDRHNSFGQQRGEMIRHLKGSSHDMHTIFKKLDLSDEQKETLKLNRKGIREVLQSQKRGLEPKDYITMDGVNRDIMIKDAEQIATVKANTKADFFEKILDILTYEQKKKFIQLLHSKL